MTDDRRKQPAGQATLTGAWALLLIGLTVGLTSCAASQLDKEAPMTLDELIEAGARVMWVGAHPDDESLCGSIFAKVGPKLGNPLFFFVLNHGDGGECNLPGGCHPDLRTVRGEEMKAVARLYKADLKHEYYYNAPLPADSFPPRHEIAEMWRDQGDPAMNIAMAIRTFRPDVLLTFDPVHGFTGHPEHQLASRFATQAVRLAADPKVEADTLPPFRVENTYYALNRYWLFVLLGGGDPGPYTETFDATQRCIGEMSCRDMMAENTRPHRTQEKDMAMVRRMKWMIDKVYLYRVDPWTEITSPYETVSHGGMH